ncbi:MAG: nucleotidyltransferase family protein [Bacteroidetes bacterium]|nr:nucleotidyltransferase family protein [Bacteroidota bacterium]
MKEAIIIAGGLGTRLQHLLPGIPKPMAPVCGKPFLYYLLSKLNKQGFTDVVLSVGHLHEHITDYFGNDFGNMRLHYSIEHTPLGTGGAIKLALQKIEDVAVVLNGDTLFDIDLQQFYSLFLKHECDLAIALKPMHDFERYGTVETNLHGRITRFVEKKYLKEGVINGGIYCLRNNFFDIVKMPQAFSFEKEILENMAANLWIQGIEFQDYFIDIGIPEDYNKAQHEFAKIDN